MSSLAASFLALLQPAPAAAQGQPALPPVNLGYSNYLDGVARPGWRFQEVIVSYSATTFRDDAGAKLAHPRDVESLATLSQFGLLSEHTLLGAYVGADVQIPIARAEVDFASVSRRERSGFGDLIVSPLVLQWHDQQLFGRPFAQRVSFTFMLPTGDYDPNRPVNAGDNTFRFNPYYAATWQFARGWEASVRAHYLWVSENDDPPASLNARTSQAGQALHANFDVSYAAAPGFRVGLGGYALEQISDDRIDGAAIAHSRERVFGFGPGFMWQTGQSTIAANLYAETGARNRPEGVRFSMRVARAF